MVLPSSKNFPVSGVGSTTAGVGSTADVSSVFFSSTGSSVFVSAGAVSLVAAGVVSPVGVVSVEV